MSSEDSPECPQCGGDMTIRTNTVERTRFYGCLDFPACKGTHPLEGQDTSSSDSLPSDRYRRKRRWEE